MAVDIIARALAANKNTGNDNNESDKHIINVNFLQSAFNGFILESNNCMAVRFSEEIFNDIKQEIEKFGYQNVAFSITQNETEYLSYFTEDSTFAYYNISIMNDLGYFLNENSSIIIQIKYNKIIKMLDEYVYFKSFIFDNYPIFIKEPKISVNEAIDFPFPGNYIFLYDYQEVFDFIQQRYFNNQDLFSINNETDEKVIGRIEINYTFSNNEYSSNTKIGIYYPDLKQWSYYINIDNNRNHKLYCINCHLISDYRLISKDKNGIVSSSFEFNFQNKKMSVSIHFHDSTTIPMERLKDFEYSLEPLNTDNNLFFNLIREYLPKTTSYECVNTGYVFKKGDLGEFIQSFTFLTPKINNNSIILSIYSEQDIDIPFDTIISTNFFSSFG